MPRKLIPFTEVRRLNEEATAAYHRHLQHPSQGPPCAACRRANADRHAELRRKRKANTQQNP